MGKCCVCYCELGRSVLGWESVVFVTVNRIGQCSGWESIFVTVNPGRCWGWEGIVFVKYCKPVSVGGGKALCLLL